VVKKKTKKKAKKKKVAKREKYNPSYVFRVKVLIEQIPLNRENGLAFGKIAKALGVSARTMLKWRTPEDPLYKPEFAVAIKEAEKELRARIQERLESVQLGKIHDAVIKKATGYKRKKVIKEPVVSGPKHPPYSRFTKGDLIVYAKNLLGLKLDKKLKKGAVENAIRKRIDEMTTEKLQIVRVEEEIIPSDVVAAKYCDQNMGKEEERWTDEQKLKHGMTEELSTVLGVISGSTKGILPSEDPKDSSNAS
jgi:hypothetical protein